jgi:hypothetical protein
MAPSALRDFIHIMQQQLDLFEANRGPAPMGFTKPQSAEEIPDGS